MLAIADRNRERTQEKTNEKKKKDKEAKENAEKEEKARMAKMIEASGRNDTGAIADKVGDKDPGATVGTAIPTETPTKRRRLTRKQTVGEIAAYPKPTPEQPLWRRSRPEKQATWSLLFPYGKEQKYADEAVAREWVIATPKKKR